MSKDKDDFQKNDYVQTIPLGVVKVKARLRDEKNNLFYGVSDANGSKWYMPWRLVKKEATDKERLDFRTKVKARKIQQERKLG